MYNNKSNEYMRPATGTYSAIDQTICDSNLFLDYNWKVHVDTGGSDHCPILLDELGKKLRAWTWKRQIGTDLKLHALPN